MARPVEKWKPCGRGYQASNFGRIRNRRGRILKQYSQNGYRKSNAGHTARLIARVWLGPPLGRKVGYRNGRKSDCRASNLYYRTMSAVAAESYMRGRINPRGERHGMAKLTERQVLEILDLLRDHTQTAIAGEYDVTPSAIGSIARGENWGWLKKAKARTARRQSQGRW